MKYMSDVPLSPIESLNRFMYSMLAWRDLKNKLTESIIKWNQNTMKSIVENAITATENSFFHPIKYSEGINLAVKAIQDVVNQSNETPII